MFHFRRLLSFSILLFSFSATWADGQDQDVLLEQERQKAYQLLDLRTQKGKSPGCYSAKARRNFRSAIKKADNVAELRQAVQRYKESVRPVQLSVGKKEHWYYIQSSSVIPYCYGGYIYDISLQSHGDKPLRWDDKFQSERFMWKFIPSPSSPSKVRIVNKATQLAIAYSPSEPQQFITTAVEQASDFDLTSCGEQRAFLIEQPQRMPVHADANGAVVAWRAKNIGSASTWHFDPVSKKDLRKNADAMQETTDDAQYELCFEDNFDVDGPINTNDWVYEKGFVRNYEPQWYQEDNVTCKDGNLVITARKETVENPDHESGHPFWKKGWKYAQYTSGSVETLGKHDILYGRMEVRAKIPVTDGAWPAIWSMGYKKDNGQWPANGEVDILEFYSKSILANVAWSDSKGGSNWRTVKTPFTHWTAKHPEWADDYHIWRMDWDSTSIRLYLDGELLNYTPLKRTTQKVGKFCKVPNPFKTPMYLKLNLALRPSDGMDLSAFPLKYYIDYVRLYQLKDNKKSAAGKR